MTEIMVNTGKYKETKTAVLVSDHFKFCVGIYTIGLNFASLGHIWTSTSYEFDEDYKIAHKIFEAINTIDKNIDQKPIFWGIIRGVEPYNDNNPNMIMFEDSVKFMEDYLEEKDITKLDDIVSKFVRVDYSKQLIISDEGFYKTSELRKVKKR